ANEARVDARCSRRRCGRDDGGRVCRSGPKFRRHLSRSRTAKYSPLVPGVSSYVAWGDTAKGPFGGFTKFRPGYDAGMHTHTADVLLVVLRGAYLYRDDAGAKRVGAGDFIRIPGGHKHWSGGDRKEVALFYQETFGKFDLI